MKVAPVFLKHGTNTEIRAHHCVKIGTCRSFFDLSVALLEMSIEYGIRLGLSGYSYTASVPLVYVS